MNYYNEHDHDAADALDVYIAAGLLPPGHVDRRSIADVAPGDLAGYTQCHFFAGIGGWSLALRLAGWPADRPVWTGSCPCQPFSAAGKRKGIDDARHLWPVWQRLIAQCRPPVVFGEQVASRDGRDWLAGLVRPDLEGLGYGVGAADLCAAGAGAPHIRQRLWFVGMADPKQHLDRGQKSAANHDGQARDGCTDRACGCHGASCGMATDSRRSPHHNGWADADWLRCRDGGWRPVAPGTQPLAHGLPRSVGFASPRIQELASVAGLDADSLKAAKRHRTSGLRQYGNAIVPEVAARFIGVCTSYEY